MPVRDNIASHLSEAEVKLQEANITVDRVTLNLSRI